MIPGPAPQPRPGGVGAQRSPPQYERRRHPPTVQRTRTRARPRRKAFAPAERRRLFPGGRSPPTRLAGSRRTTRERRSFGWLLSSSRLLGRFTERLLRAARRTLDARSIGGVSGTGNSVPSYADAAR